MSARQTRVVRLFAAVWPAPEVQAVLRSFPRDDVPGLRWTTPEQWHVTLGFFGDVPDAERAGLWAAVVEAAGSVTAAPVATLGTRTELLGTGVLCVAVDGLDALGTAVHRRADRWMGGDLRPFRGHLTLARARRVTPDAPGGDGPARRRPGRRGTSVPPDLVGRPLQPEVRALVASAGVVPSGSGPSWVAGAVCLVGSTLDGSGARYATVDSVPVGIP